MIDVVDHLISIVLLEGKNNDHYSFMPSIIKFMPHYKLTIKLCLKLKLSYDNQSQIKMYTYAEVGNSVFWCVIWPFFKFFRDLLQVYRPFYLV